MKIFLPSLFLVTLFLLKETQAWDNDDLELFDLVEEVNQNFYTLLDVNKDANSTEIKKAYRRLSLTLHPDKSDAPDAHIKFRQIVAVYEVLKDQNRRVKYDQVLENGLPDWRHAVYYYRRARKMGFAEMAIILFIIITIGQYVVSWAAYIENKFTAEQFLTIELKKLQKKQRKGKYDGPPLPEKFEVNIPTPSVLNTLPFQLPLWIWLALKIIVRRCMERKVKEEPPTSEEEEEEEPEPPPPPRRRKIKTNYPEANENSSGWEPKHKHYRPPELTNESTSSSLPPVTGGLWTDDDLIELAQMVKKFPPGTPSRWELIAETMHRQVGEVAYMARKIKDDGYKVPKGENENNEDDQEIENDKPRKTKTKGGKIQAKGEEGGGDWGQAQQRALETALQKFPKGSCHDRWDKIARLVPGKSRDECMLRFKYLADLVRKKNSPNVDSPGENQESAEEENSNS